MPADGAKRVLAFFKAIHHDGAFERGDDEGCQLSGIDLRVDLPGFDSRAGDRKGVATPTGQRVAGAFAQDGISVVLFGSTVLIPQML